MLKSIKIKNFVIIEDQEIDFEEKINVLLGQTGSGKSVILKAIALLTGQRANTNLIRTGVDSAIIQGKFKITNSLQSRLDNLGIESFDELEVFRQISRDNKNIVRVNGTRIAVSELTELFLDYIDLHSQNQTSNLLEESNHINIVDKLSKNDVTKYREEFTKYAQKTKEKLELEKEVLRKEEQLEIIEYRIQELEVINEIDDFEQLQIQKEEIQTSLKAKTENEKLIKAVNYAHSSLQEVKSVIETSETDLSKRLLASFYELEDLSYELNKSFNYENEADLGVITEQISSVKQLMRKHRRDFDELKNYQEELKQEVTKLHNAEENLQKLSKEIEELKTYLESQATQLSNKRKQFSEYLQEQVNQNLNKLQMAEASFKIVIEKQELDKNGFDKLTFLIKTNHGTKYGKLKGVASGGELSRVMLALKAVLALDDDSEIIIFDEIDTGVSGAVASLMGKLIKQIGIADQVILITHSAQVAAVASRYLLVTKESDETKTDAKVMCLKQEEIVNEIARLISGETITQEAILQAHNILNDN